MSVFYANKKYFIYAHINKINQKPRSFVNAGS